MPFPRNLAEEEPIEGPCGFCLKDPPHFVAHRSVYVYEDPVRTLILLYKDVRRYALANVLGGCVARLVLREWDETSFDGVVPVPGSARRRLLRGFDPADLIARAAARRLGLPFIRGLKLRRNPAPQKGLSAAGRRRNLRGAFVPHRLPRGDLSLLLVDDVFTTGATLRETSRVLAGAGAEVRAASVAVAVRRTPQADAYPGGIPPGAP